jgi:hypothetical protein
MNRAILATTITFLFAAQTTLAAKEPLIALPSAAKKPAAKQKTFLLPDMNEKKQKAAAPVQEEPLQSAFEDDSSVIAIEKEPEAIRPLESLENPIPAQALRSADRPRSTSAQNAPAQPALSETILLAEPEADVNQELNLDAETKLDSTLSKTIDRPVLKNGITVTAEKPTDLANAFSDDDLGITQYLKKDKSAAQTKKTHIQPGSKLPDLQGSDNPLVELPEAIDGYSPEYNEGKSQMDDENTATDATLLASGPKKAPGSLEFDMESVDMLADSIEPTGEMSEVAKRK